MLTVNEDLKNRVTYSVLLQKLAPDSLVAFIRAELDKVALAHTTFTDDALSLIVRSSRRRAAASAQPVPQRLARSRTRPHQNRRPEAGQPRFASAPLAQGGRPAAANAMRNTNDAVVVPTKPATALAACRHHSRACPATMSVADCDGSEAFSRNLYDVRFELAYDVSSASNTDPPPLRPCQSQEHA